MKTAQLLITLLVLSQASQAADLTGKVVAIADGDTFTLLTPQKEQVKIRLAEIDAPESGQPYGNLSKQALSDLLFGKQVRVEVQTTDRYGRTVGRLDLVQLGVISRRFMFFAQNSVEPAPA